jgi:hypothetical protein
MTTPLQAFQQLGNDVEQRWRAQRYAVAAFPAIARAALTGHALHERMTHLDLVRDAVQSPGLPPQYGANFGQPPLNVYVGSGFYIEVLTWVESTTSVHQHNFSGAFQVLAGSSMHTRYSFSEEQRYGNRFLTGTVQFHGAERLQRGQISEIRSGAGLIHALFHLDHPSATIVVRTDDEATGPQYNYEKPHIAIDPFHVPEPFRTQSRLLQMLAGLKSPDFTVATADALRHSDVWCSYRLLEIANRHLSDAHALEPLLAVVQEQHGAVAEVMRACLAEARRQANIQLRRDRVRDSDHRYFLALLLNLPDRAAILDMVRARYPDSDPVEWLVAQVDALARADHIGLAFDKVSLAALEGLLRNETDENVLHALGARFGAGWVQAQRGALASLFAELRAALLLRPLFA